MKKSNGIIAYTIIIAIVIALIFFFQRSLYTQTNVTYSQYRSFVEEEKIAQAQIEQNAKVPTGSVLFFVSGSSTEYRVFVSDVNAELDRLQDNGIKVTLTAVKENYFLNTLLPVLILVIGISFVFVAMTGRMAAPGGGSGGGQSMANFGRSRAVMETGGSKKVLFKDVAGLQEEKEELEEVVDFLKNPNMYTSLGARIPKGILLVGPPGTGKTLLAKAVAGEAGVPFFSISGSNFVEMFVGVGASRVRDLFEQAKRNAPCIIFIDEIDAVARRRGTGLGGGHDEREQTLNQMLVEMDGFGVNEGIIVMAATNRVDILDPAILRPGRFDRKVAVGRPDVKGREEILKVHTKNKPLGSDVNLRRVAQTTAGFTGADLENLMNEAAINAAKSKQGYISQRDIEQSFVKVGIGAEKHSKVISDKEKRITAYHESGHAILFHVLPHESQVHTISIIPTGMGAAGYTMPLPEADEMFMTKKRMEEDIIVAFGGRVAEELIFGDVTTGASQDIKQATATARAMVVKYGMSERLGTINYEDSGEEEVFLGRDLGHARSYSEDVAREIDIEVKRIIDEAYAQAKTIITEHMDVLHRCAQVLIEREKIGNAEFEAIFDGRELPKPGVEQTSLMSGMPSEGR